MGWVVDVVILVGNNLNLFGVVCQCYGGDCFGGNVLVVGGCYFVFCGQVDLQLDYFQFVVVVGEGF